VALTLPDDVLQQLSRLHADPAWAVVKLVEAATGTPPRSRPAPLLELVQLPGRRALIVVRPEPFRNLRGVSTIPLADGRSFLALESGQGMAHLELAAVDRLEDPAIPDKEREALIEIRRTLRGWRAGPGLIFSTRSIILVERAPNGQAPRELGALGRRRTRRPRRTADGSSGPEGE
jgi:hypothetical protein